MRLAFKNFRFGYSLKEVPITLNIGTLEDLCKELKIEFYQIHEEVKKNNFDFMTELLYQGYLTACCELFKQGKLKKIKYDRVKAILWYEQMGVIEQKELLNKMTDLFGEITKTTGSKKKVTTKQHGSN